MKIPALFKEYIWLVNTIRKAGRISLSDINDLWLDTDMSEGIEIARTTFNRHRNAIEDIFGINIDCDRRSGYKYYISNPEVLKEGSVQNWMLSTLTLGSIINDSMSLHESIIAEPVSVDDYILEQLTEAMKTGHRVNILYRQYGSPQSYWTGADPYCLKLFSQQWYLLAKVFGSKFVMLSLNKIEDVRIQHHTFKTDKDFNAKDFFDDYFGVGIDEEVPKLNIKLRAHGDERFEVRDVPVHRSQSITHWDDDGDYADFELSLKPTPDFIDYLLSKSGRLQVLSPQSVIDQLKSRIERTNKMYNDNKD